MLVVVESFLRLGISPPLILIVTVDSVDVINASGNMDADL